MTHDIDEVIASGRFHLVPVLSDLDPGEAFNYTVQTVESVVLEDGTIDLTIRINEPERHKDKIVPAKLVPKTLTTRLLGPRGWG